jgi:hypothetical protein
VGREKCFSSPNAPGRISFFVDAPVSGEGGIQIEGHLDGVWGLNIFELEGRFSFKRPVNEWVNELN